MVGIAVSYAKYSISESYLDTLLNPTGFIIQGEKKLLTRLKAKPEGLFLYDAIYDEQFFNTTINESLI